MSFRWIPCGLMCNFQEGLVSRLARNKAQRKGFMLGWCAGRILCEERLVAGPGFARPELAEGNRRPPGYEAANNHPAR